VNDETWSEAHYEWQANVSERLTGKRLIASITNEKKVLIHDTIAQTQTPYHMLRNSSSECVHSASENDFAGLVISRRYSGTTTCACTIPELPDSAATVAFW